MGFRLVPKSVTLNGVGLDRYLAFFRPIRYLWGPITSKWLKIDLYSVQRKCSPNNLVFSDISFMEISAEVTENERITDRPLREIQFSIMTRLKVSLFSRFDQNRPISTI